MYPDEPDPSHKNNLSQASKSSLDDSTKSKSFRRPAIVSQPHRRGLSKSVSEDKSKLVHPKANRSTTLRANSTADSSASSVANTAFVKPRVPIQKHKVMCKDTKLAWKN